MRSALPLILISLAILVPALLGCDLGAENDLTARTEEIEQTNELFVISQDGQTEQLLPENLPVEFQREGLPYGSVATMVTSIRVRLHSPSRVRSN